MEPLIFSDDEVTCDPADTWCASLQGRVVLCTVENKQYLRIVKETVDVGATQWFLIGNAKGFTNGWITIDSIHGVVTMVER